MELGSKGQLSATPSFAAANNGPQVSGAGAAPTITGGPVNEFLYNAGVSANSDVSPSATSSTGAFFTTSRVFPDSATLSYPWRAAGKLFFHDPRTNGNFICSASVLRPRLIVTAGHCVYQAKPASGTRYFFNNFLFVPAFRQIPPAASVAPYCSWTTAYRITTGAWAWRRQRSERAGCRAHGSDRPDVHCR